MTPKPYGSGEDMSTTKLQLKSEMGRSYLIQRLKKPRDSRPSPFGSGFGMGGQRFGGLSEEAMGLLSGVFSFDYMGAAQFEWGAVPAALEFIYDEAQKGHVTPGQHRGVSYICPRQYVPGVHKIIDALLTNEESLHLLEHCGLKDAVSSSSRGRHDIVGWLELDNGFFMFTDSEMFGNTKRLFGVK